MVETRYGWGRAAARFEAAYDRALANTHRAIRFGGFLHDHLLRPRDSWAQRVFSRVQRQRDDREPGDYRAAHRAQRLTPNYEIIVVNDGSADGTAEILDELARIYPQVRVVHHAKNRGYGGALRSGFETASRDLVSTRTATRSTTPPRWRSSGTAWATAWIS